MIVSADFMGSSIGPKIAIRMSPEIEDMDYNIPSGLAVIGLVNWHTLDERSCAAVSRFDSLLKLAWRHFWHGLRCFLLPRFGRIGGGRRESADRCYCGHNTITIFIGSTVFADAER